MPLPVNIKELINGRAVEWERIEFKEGSNRQLGQILPGSRSLVIRDRCRR
ncbi:MAG TPA: hypothetical protein VK469_15505 [Candidatus Kapabacteria bacterium]|nr:hypothetical protein [Candidatus Kapabacteria bacterium]